MYHEDTFENGLIKECKYFKTIELILPKLQESILSPRK